MITRYKSFLFGFFLFASTAFGQLTAPSTTNQTMSVPSLTNSVPEKASAQISPDAMIFDGPISAREYKMGPGDIVQYRSWTSNDVQLLMVSADQLLVIPRIGEFSVKGKTLEEIKQDIYLHASSLFKRHGSVTDSLQNLFSLSLVQPRRIYVSVQGEVTTPGVYSYTGGTRAIVAVNVANRPVQHTTIFADDAFQKLQEERKREEDRLRPYLGIGNEQTSSQRNIIVTHSDGSMDRIDIPRFNATRDPRFCPLLREGDVIYVPFKKMLAGQEAVYGAVNSPQSFEYIEGDSLWGMIQACYGPTANADIAHVELTHMSGNGEGFTTDIIDCAAIKAGHAPDIKLQVGDRVFVRDNPDLRELSKVVVKGEVMHPGVYPITRTTTKLSDVIKQAGGFTQYAFLAGGTIIRQKLDIDNKDITTEDEAKLVGRLSNLETVDTTNFRLLTEVRQSYVSVDMRKVFSGNDHSADVELRDGDVISIPASPNTVYVWGYVGSMGYIPFQPGAKVDYYVKLAGGYAEGAVIKGTRIIKVRTRQYANPADTDIEPGDEIYVPKEGTFPPDYALQRTSNIVGLIGGIVGTILSAVTLVLVLKK